MAEEESVKKIQKSINDILGIKSGLIKKRPSGKEKRRELFNTVLTGLAHINGRSFGLKHDYHIDLSHSIEHYVDQEHMYRLQGQ